MSLLAFKLILARGTRTAVMDEDLPYSFGVCLSHPKIMNDVEHLVLIGPPPIEKCQFEALRFYNVRGVGDTQLTLLVGHNPGNQDLYDVKAELADFERWINKRFLVTSKGDSPATDQLIEYILKD